MVKLSVVIPAYQCATTIRICLDKLLEAKYEGQYQVIAVNDGSSDETPSILKEYAEKHPQLLVIDQLNRGVSAARNVGLNNASGEYIAFVDSDDYTEPDFIDSLLECIKQPADLILFNSDTVDAVGRRKTVNCSGSYANLDYEKTYHLALRQQLNHPWGKLFRTNILHENKILFKEEISIGEDLTFLLEYFRYIKTIRYDCRILYHYVDSAGSLSHTHMTERRVQQFMLAYQSQESFLIEPQTNKQVLMRSYIDSIFRSVMLSGNLFHNIKVWKNAYDPQSKLEEIFRANYDLKTNVKKAICNVLMK